MGNGQYRINWPGIHFDRRTEVHPTVLRDVTTAVSDSEAHAVEHAEVVDRSGPKRYSYNKRRCYVMLCYHEKVIARVHTVHLMNI